MIRLIKIINADNTRLNILMTVIITIIKIIIDHHSTVKPEQLAREKSIIISNLRSVAFRVQIHAKSYTSQVVDNNEEF